jgi:hypothetical protein
MGQNRTLHVLKMADRHISPWRHGEQRRTRRSQEERRKVRGFQETSGGAKNNDESGRTKSKKENLGLSKELHQLKLNDIFKNNIFPAQTWEKTEHFMY